MRLCERSIMVSSGFRRSWINALRRAKRRIGQTSESDSPHPARGGALLETKIREHGPTPKAWTGIRSLHSACDLLAQLLKIVDRPGPLTINDYGCGYGALLDYLKESCDAFQYSGFDISSRKFSTRRAYSVGNQGGSFVSRVADLSPADFTIASGIFNVRLKAATAMGELLH